VIFWEKVPEGSSGKGKIVLRTWPRDNFNDFNRQREKKYNIVGHIFFY
jgi:hypothetical protein